MTKKTLALLLGVAVASLALAGCGGQRGIHYGAFYGLSSPHGAQVSLGFFYDRLAPYGEWVELPEYGQAWVPNDVPVGWRPYTHGRWVYADDYGWLWVSDWSWGWAAFHYGRWYDSDPYGWVWIPGQHWGPAWVAWRRGGDYVGWAPLPPNVRWRMNVGLELGGADLDHIPHHDWVFVHERHFLGPIHEYALGPDHNDALFGHTQNVTRYRSEHGRVDIRSIDRGRIEHAIGHHVERFQVASARNPEEMRLPGEHPGHIRIYRPRISASQPVRMRPGQLTSEERFRRQQEAQAGQLLEQFHAEERQMFRRHRGEERTARNRPEMLRLHHQEEQALHAEHEHELLLFHNRLDQQRHEFERRGASQHGSGARRQRNTGRGRDRGH